MFRREFANDSLSFVIKAFKRQRPSVGPLLGFVEVGVCVCVCGGGHLIFTLASGQNQVSRKSVSLVVIDWQDR